MRQYGVADTVRSSNEFLLLVADRSRKKLLIRMAERNSCKDYSEQPQCSKGTVIADRQDRIS